MILTNCAACAAPLAHTAPRCVRCHVRYCDSTSNCPGATLDDLREAVTTTEETTRTSRRVLGDAHPETAGGEHNLQKLRAALRAREARESS